MQPAVRWAKPWPGPYEPVHTQAYGYYTNGEGNGELVA